MASLPFPKMSGCVRFSRKISGTVRSYDPSVHLENVPLSGTPEFCMPELLDDIFLVGVSDLELDEHGNYKNVYVVILDTDDDGAHFINPDFHYKDLWLPCDPKYIVFRTFNIQKRTLDGCITCTLSNTTDTEDE